MASEIPRERPAVVRRDAPHHGKAPRCGAFFRAQPCSGLISTGPLPIVCVAPSAIASLPDSSRSIHGAGLIVAWSDAGHSPSPASTLLSRWKSTGTRFDHDESYALSQVGRMTTRVHAVH